MTPDALASNWTSLSGTPTAGDEIVRLIYMDEAGTSNPEHEPYLVVASAIVHADRQAKHLESELRRLREKHCPDAPKGFAFHAMAIFNGESGNKYFSREKWPKEKRWAILDELVRIPAKFDVPIIYGVIDRNEDIKSGAQPATPREKQFAVHQTAFLVCAIKTDWWLRQNTPEREVALMIAEDVPDIRKALRDLQAFGREPQETEKLLAGWQKVLPFRKIIDTLHYAQKADSSLLQLADVAAFVIKRQAMANDRPMPEGQRFYDPLRYQASSPVLKVVEEQQP